MDLFQINARIEGLTPLITHNGRLADPTYEGTIALKKLTSKRTKTDEDLKEMARLECFYGLYLDDKGKVCIPADMILGLFREAGKTKKLGKVVQAAVFADEPNFPLIYEGPKDPAKVATSSNHRDYRGMVVMGRRVMRSRAIFRKWAVEFTITADPTVMDIDQVKELLEIGGRVKGLGDSRPAYGRFLLKSWEAKPIALADLKSA